MAQGVKTGGRKAGTPNKLTRQGREAFERAFQTIGGPEALAQWAMENRTDFYKLYARLLPQEIEAKHDGKLVIEIKPFGGASDEAHG